jgi:hypothetical protein
MAKKRLDPKLLEKLATRTGKKEKYLREQISKRANRLGISAEAALIVWARQLNIGTASYLRKLSPNIQEEVRSAIPSVFAVERRRPKKGPSYKTRPGSSKTNIRLAIDYLVKDEELRGRCKDLLMASRHFDRVFREATTVLDDRLKRISGIAKMKPADLVGKALNPDPQKAVIHISSDKAEQEGFFNICKGMMLSFRDSTHHVLSENFTREDALKFCGFVDSILAVLSNAKVHQERR